MTDQDWTELGRRAVACRRFRWRRGMSTICGLVAQSNDDANGRVYFGQWVEPHPDWLPDLRDPATLGCLLALVREAVEPERAPGDWPMVCTYQNAAKKWGVGAWLNESGKATFAALVLPTYDTEAAALVAALGSAP